MTIGRSLRRYGGKLSLGFGRLRFGRFGFGLRHSVRRRLVLTFALVLLAPALIVSFVSYQSASSGVKAELVRNASANVQLINDDITKYIQPEVSNITYLGERITQQTWNASASSGGDATGSNTSDGSDTSGTSSANDASSTDLNTLLSNFSLTHPELVNLEFASSTGFYQNFPMQQPPAGYDATKTPWYQAAMQKLGRVAILDPYQSKLLGGEWVIGISVTVQDGSGVIHAELPVSSFTQLLKGIEIGHTGYPLIIDDQKKVVADPGFKVGENISSQPWAKQMFASHDGSAGATVRGAQTETIFTTNQLTGWKVAGMLYLSDAASTARPILTATMIVLLIALLLGILLVYFNIRSIMRPLRSLLQTSEKIRDGDLTQTAVVHSRDEFGVLANSFNDMVAALKTVITEVTHTSQQLAASSEELSASAEETTQATQQIAASMQNIASGSDTQLSHVGGLQEAISDFERVLFTLAENAQHVNMNAEDAAKIAENGHAVLNKSVEQMEFINRRMGDITNVVQVLRTRSDEIGDVVKTITTIAGQTNLLALNAAIEAARAGEQGRGFAVVADEVRKLAEESRAMAAQIGKSITMVQADIQNAVASASSGTAAVSEGIQITNQAGKAFQGILKAVEQVAMEIKSVSTAIQGLVDSTAISSGVRGVYDVAAASVQSTTNASAYAEEQMATMQEVAASATSLSHLAERLQQLLAQFTF